MENLDIRWLSTVISILALAYSIGGYSGEMLTRYIAGSEHYKAIEEYSAEEVIRMSNRSITDNMLASGMEVPWVIYIVLLVVLCLVGYLCHRVVTLDKVVEERNESKKAANKDKKRKAIQKSRRKERRMEKRREQNRIKKNEKKDSL